MHNISIHHFTTKSKLRQAQIMHFLIICKSEIGIGTLRKVGMSITLFDKIQISRFDVNIVFLVNYKYSKYLSVKET